MNNSGLLQQSKMDKNDYTSRAVLSSPNQQFLESVSNYRNREVSTENRWHNRCYTMGTMPKDFLTLLSHCITQCRLTWDRRSSILERIRNLYLFIQPYYTELCNLNPRVSNLLFSGERERESLSSKMPRDIRFTFLFQHALMALLLWVIKSAATSYSKSCFLRTFTGQCLRY